MVSRRRWAQMREPEQERASVPVQQTALTQAMTQAQAQT